MVNGRTGEVYRIQSRRCGYISKENRHGSMFMCKNCGFELNRDLNASRNIKVLGISEYFIFLSANRFGSMKLHSRMTEIAASPKL